MSNLNGNGLIKPHGGKLINCYMNESEKKEYLAKITDYPAYELNSYNLADIECITTGLYSPLTGFLGKEDYESVVNTMRLKSGVIWSIPVTLSASEEYIQKIDGQKEINLRYEDNNIAVLKISDIYKPDKKEEARKVFLTDDENHPGVKVVYESGEYYIGGELRVFEPIKHSDFNDQRRTPAETREYFQKKGWKTIVAFQTRNPIHRAHEYLQKVALEMVDGLLVNPLVGTTKNDDIPADVRMQSYIEILDKYYPSDKVLLSVFPAAMRYAGPREAIMHAIARKNFGCTHFIVGRDHAGVGNYYGTYDAQKIFDQFDPKELEITPLKFEHAFYCNKCGQMGTDKTCPHGKEDRVFLSGTKVREILSNGGQIPKEFTRPEVAEILRQAYKKKEN